MNEKEIHRPHLVCLHSAHYHKWKRHFFNVEKQNNASFHFFLQKLVFELISMILNNAKNNVLIQCQSQNVNH